MMIQAAQQTSLSSAFITAERKSYLDACRQISRADLSLRDIVREFAKLSPNGFDSAIMAKDLMMESKRTELASAASSLAAKGELQITSHLKPKTYRRIADAEIPAPRAKRKSPEERAEPLLMDMLSTKLAEHEILTSHVEGMIETLSALGYKVSK